MMCGSLNWTGDRLTAIRTCSGQRVASASAVRNTNVPILPIMPHSSANGMNFSGEMAPRTGWFQRTNASKPAISSLAARTIG